MHCRHMLVPLGHHLMKELLLLGFIRVLIHVGRLLLGTTTAQVYADWRDVAPLVLLAVRVHLAQISHLSCTAVAHFLQT